MAKTRIGWTQYNWNVVTGCQKIRPGCGWCYASEIAERFAGTPQFPNGFGYTERLYKMNEPQRIKDPSLIFVESMSDFFWHMKRDEILAEQLTMMRSCPQHRFQVLTKRIERAEHYIRKHGWPDNAWLGVSVENQHWQDVTVPQLVRLKRLGVRVAWISAEPLYEKVQFDLRGIDWVVAGGLSGAGMGDPYVSHRKGLCLYDAALKLWVPTERGLAIIRSVRDQCKESGTAFFFKQWGGTKSHSGGNRLDGHLYEAYPELPIAP